MPDPTSSAAAIAAAAGHPAPEPSTMSSAERIAAARPRTAEQPQAHSFMSHRDIRKDELRGALRRRGLDRHSDAIERQLNLAPETGDPDEWAAEIAERWPGLFQPPPKSTSTEHVERLLRGEAQIRPGS